jgi:hypothetical protein
MKAICIDKTGQFSDYTFDLPLGNMRDAPRNLTLQFDDPSYPHKWHKEPHMWRHANYPPTVLMQYALQAKYYNEQTLHYIRG